MKKLLIAVLVVLVSTGTAMAVGFDMTGMFYVRGSAISNDNGLQNDAVDYMYYDQEFDATTKLTVNDQTRVILNFEITDQNWMTGSTDGARSAASGGITGDDNIAFKRVFGVHTFGNGTQLDFGLMTGGTWGTGFAETGTGRWRLKAAHMFEGFGKLFVIVEKNSEQGAAATATEDAEKDDGDAFYVALVTKLGGIGVKPLIGYVDSSNIVLDQDSGDRDLYLAQLALDGTFGSVGFEAEVDYFDYSYDSTAIGTDYSTYGAYLNVWMNMDAVKVGGLVAYGSYDDDANAGFGFGEDFTPTIFGADWATVGTSGLSEYNAVTLGQIYVSFAASEAMALGASGTYWTSNSDTGDSWEDADGYELDATCNYKLSDPVTYTVAAAYGQFNMDATAYGSEDQDSFYRFYHRIKISF